MYTTYCADVECVLKRRPLKYGKWIFDVMEYYGDVGTCDQLNLCSLPMQQDNLLGKAIFVKKCLFLVSFYGLWY